MIGVDKAQKDNCDNFTLVPLDCFRLLLPKLFIIPNDIIPSQCINSFFTMLCPYEDRLLPFILANYIAEIGIFLTYAKQDQYYLTINHQ